jgi:hypothetical protein
LRDLGLDQASYSDDPGALLLCASSPNARSRRAWDAV